MSWWEGTRYEERKGFSAICVLSPGGCSLLQASDGEEGLMSGSKADGVYRRVPYSWYIPRKRHTKESLTRKLVLVSGSRL